MRALAPTVLAITLSGFASASHAAAPDIAGRWATQGFGSIVAFAPCVADPAAWCGRIIWLWAPSDASGRPRRDVRNPDAAERFRPLVGVQIVEGLHDVSPGVWSQGRVYNPEDGRTYTGSVQLRGRTLELRGCALKVVCQTQIWRRPQDILAATEGR